jgi:hypothetical protein
MDLRWKIFRKFCRLDRTKFFFFAPGDERDGAPERGTGVGLEREMVCWRGLVSDVRLGWTSVPSIEFVAGEERDGASERGTGVRLEREMVHWRGLVASFGLGWTPVPSIESCGVGEKNDGYVLYGVLILF